VLIEAWLAEYFAVRVLHSLAPQTRRFLEASSVLETLNVEACRAVTQAADAAELIDELAESHLFARRAGPQEVTLLPLFRSTLREVLRRRRPSPLARWSARAAEFFLSSGDPAAALRTLLDAGEQAPAVDLLRRAAPGAVAGGRSEELRGWILLFPAEARERDPWLLHYLGVSLRLAGDYADAWQAQERAQLAFRSANTRDGDAYASAELGMLACLLKRPAEAEELLEEARTALGASDEVVHATVLCALADAYVALNRLREATRAGEEAVAMTASEADSSFATVHVHALQGLAMVYVREGAFDQAYVNIRRAIEFSREHHLDVETTTRSLLVLGIVHFIAGDLELADQTLMSAAAAAARHGLTALIASIDVARAWLLADLGRLDEAERLFNEAGPSEFLLVDGRAGLGWLRVLQNRIPEARGLFRQILEESSLLGNVADVGRAKVSLGVIALQLNRLDEAEQWLLDAARGFEESGTRYRLAGAHLHLAYLYLTRNDVGRARRYLRMCLDYASAATSYDFFLWHPLTVAKLAVFALREGIHADYVEALCVRRLQADEVAHFLPLLSRSQPSLSAIARRIVDTLLSREPDLSVAGLDQCADQAARMRLTRAIIEGCLTARGLIVLRHQYRLTWAEADVFVAYYLSDISAMAESSEPERRGLARRLAISENTLRHHITSIRHKLGLGSGRGSANMFVWALMTGIAAWPPANSNQAV
jgi:ATP/maltotriose-dependent transcriptional regulator MalT